MRIFKFFKFTLRKEKKHKRIFDIMEDIHRSFGLYSDNMVFDTYDRLKMDIQYLDNSRFEIEMALRYSGKDLNYCYEYKYKTSTEENEWEKTFGNSATALMVLLKSFWPLYVSSTEEKKAELEQIADNCIDNLEKVRQMLKDEDTVRAFLKETQVN